MKPNKQMIKKSISKILIVLIFVGLNWAGFSAIGQTFAYFSDTKIFTDNTLQTGVLDMTLRSGQNNFVPLDKSSNMKPGDTVSRDIYIKKEGSLPFKYIAHSEPISGFCDEEYYNALKLKVWYNYYYDYEPYDPDYHKNRTMAQKYDGLLKDFNLPSDDSDLQISNSHPYFNNIFYGVDEHWFYFQIILPTDAPNTLEDKICQFKFIFDGWQTNLPDSSQGFTDTEEITNTITSVDWTPPVISNVESLIATPGENNELKALITWKTDESSNSFVDYGLDISYGNTVGQDDSVTQHSVEISGLVEDTTYHFRVRSKDAYNNEAVSEDYTFEIDGSRWGVGWSNIVINEFLPDPLGDDSAPMPDGEWVELYNKSTDDVDVSGWFLTNSSPQKVYINSSNTNTGGTTVPAKGFLVVYLNSQYADWLDNDTDIVSLFVGKWLWLIDFHAYNKLLGDIVLENKSFARIPDGSNTWYDPIPTPGAPNKLSEEEKMELGLLSLEEQIATTTTTTISDDDDLENSTTASTTISDEAITMATTTESLMEEVTTSTTTASIISEEESITTTTEPPVNENQEELNSDEEDALFEQTTEEQSCVEEIVVEELTNEEVIDEEVIDEGQIIVENQPAIEDQPVAVPDNNFSDADGAEESVSDDNISSVEGAGENSGDNGVDTGSESVSE